MKYCFLDLETTGFDAEKDSIIEIAYIVHERNKTVVAGMDAVVIPEKSKLTDTVTHITGITQSEVDENGIRFNSLVSQIQEDLSDCVIVGHNIDFDIRFLQQNGIDMSTHNRIDTHEIARIILPNESSYALEVLSQTYGFAHTDAHRAMSDVEANADLFYWLCDKIHELPQSFRDSITEFLRNKTEWHARFLFLDSPQSMNQSTLNHQVLASIPDNRELCEESAEWILDMKEGDNVYISQSYTVDTACVIQHWTQCVTRHKRKSLVVTSHRDFYNQQYFFTAPCDFIDEKRLQLFCDKRSMFDDQESTFYLKCRYRLFLSRYTRHDYDLFFQERDLWNQVCGENEDTLYFQEQILSITSESSFCILPQHFTEFYHLPLFQDRLVFIDEAESFAIDLLFSSTTQVSLRSSLSHENEEISMATQFWIARFCRDFLESKLQKTMSGFPEKIELSVSDDLESYRDGIENLGLSKSDQLFLDDFLSQSSAMQRWVEYYPESGNLVFGTWNPSDWEQRKSDLSSFQCVYFHRHVLDESFSFFRIFLGCTHGTPRILSLKKSYGNIQIPDHLISVKSPDFNAFCTRFLEDLIPQVVKPDSFLVAHFSSLDAIKKSCHDLTQVFADQTYTILGEKVAGGDGKVLEKLSQSSSVILFDQRMSSPKLATHPFSVGVLQKFVFLPPHPVISFLQSHIESSISFWDTWIIPHVVSLTARRLAQYPEVKTIWCLDSRASTSWGKKILHDIQN